MIRKILQFFRSNWPILCILIIGAYLRLYHIELYMTFLGDEGRDVLIVKRMILDGKWTLLGPTASVGGFFMGPIYYYFMLPFLWLWNFNPVGPAIMVALFGIATIFLIYYAGTKIFGKDVGLSSSILYALSPLVISYSRSSWNPNIVPFFAILLFYLLWDVVSHNHWKRVFVIGIILGLGLQLHYVFLSLFGVCFLWFVFFGRYKAYIKYYGMGILGFIIGFSPFLAFEVRHGFSNTRSIVSFVFEGKDTGFIPSHFISNILDVYFRIFGRLMLRVPDMGVLGNLPMWDKTFLIYGTWTFCALGIGLFLGYVFFSKRLWKLLGLKKEDICSYQYGLMLLYLWLIVTLTFFGFYKKNIYDYYFGIMYFVPFFIIGIWFSIGIRKTMITRGIAIVCICFLSIYNWEGRPFKFVPNNQLGQVEMISREVINKSDGKPFNFALITGGNSDHAYRYFFELWNQAPVTIENIMIDPERKSVTDQLLIVCEDIFCQPLGNSLWEVAGFGRAEIEGQWDVSVVKIFKLRKYTE